MRPVKMTQKNDPPVRLKIPGKLTALLKAKAKENRRTIQDEVIKRLAATLDLDHTQAQTLCEIQSLILPQLKPFYP